MKTTNLIFRAMHAAAILCAFVAPAIAASPEVKIASDPLFNGLANIHPNMLLTLSVEFPTVGVAYTGDKGTYNRNVEYVGYFNPLKCYDYNGGNRNLSDSGYFVIKKDANPSIHECGGDSFSGNFMNWAASSAIDMLRYALTGGDRIIDTPSETILQRAVLQDSASANFYAHSTYFPRRKVVVGGNVSAPDQVTPFKTGTLYVVSCRNRILFSDSSSGLAGGTNGSKYCTYPYDGKTAPPPEAVDKKLGEYLVRVKVCDATEGPKRTDLCQKYSGGYKPVGEVQRKSERMRIGAMGYLLDDAKSRYGGVLRAPLKYVGPKKFEAPEFVELTNDKPEWDADTGVFANNPNSAAEPNSGVLNYLNKFGRSGIYKTYDPVSELYYEGMRYLQGKQPTPEALSGLTDAMKDGFPATSAWTDPITASCQKNYMLAIADVNTHWDRYIPGNTRTTYGGGLDAYDSVRPADTAVAGKTPSFDVTTWTKKVGDMETGGKNPSPNPVLTTLDTANTGSGGHGTHYMAGLAYWANTNDIRLDKKTRVKTFTIDVDEGGNGLIDGNVRTIKPRNSQLYLAAKYGGFDDRNGDGNPFTTTDCTNVGSVSNVEWDNGNGVPANYFLAGQPKEMIQSVRKVFNAAGAASGTISGVSLSTTHISSGGAYAYQPGFDSRKWGGVLKKLALITDSKGGVNIASSGACGIAPSEGWDAGEVLTGTDTKAANPLPLDRKIYTAYTKADGSLSTIEFKWSALDDVQKALLNTSPADQSSDGLGEKRLAYLRGERNLETSKPDGIFRARERVLGDIVNSTPAYVGAPSTSEPGGEYLQFYKSWKERTKAVYIGANDGMLHAFNAGDGKELFAYVPNVLMSKMAQLTMPEYAHQPYVDGPLTVAEAKVGGQWKTVLASGMGGGAQGVFALDVTNPAAFESGAGALFEFTDADDPDMGNVVGQPVIAKFKTGMKNGVPEYKYFLVVSSGLNNYKSDGALRFNADAASALFLLSLDKSPSVKWVLGSNYFKFRTPSKDAALQNGLAGPALVVGAGGSVRYAYAGDLQGNLWRFDFNGSPPWDNALPDSTPLFTAKDALDKRQPITTQPRVVFAPGGGYLLLFGTGKFVENTDTAPGGYSTQSFYAIHDTANSTFKIIGREALEPRTLLPAGTGPYQISGKAFSYGEGDGKKHGWYVDFPASDKSGERVVTRALVLDGSLFFNSLIPGTDPCAGGGGRSYAMNVLTGLPDSGNQTGVLSSVGMLGTPVVIETETKVSDRNSVGRRSVTKKRTAINFGTGGAKGMSESVEDKESVVPAGRFSWREILNWKELRDAFAKK
jgi:type IV pilus assembly protein PilY1